ncbi:MAG: alpha/beta hydrolase, partial [Rhodoglobus sp.]
MGAQSLHEGRHELLFDVTAVLSTSTNLGSVAEAFGVHEISRFATSISTQENVPLVLPLTTIDLTSLHAGAAVEHAPVEVTADGPLAGPVVGPLPDAPAGADKPNDSVQSSRLLGRIALLPADQIEQFVRNNSGAVGALLVNRPQSRDVGLWWSSMSFDARTALRGAAPELVGNLDGIPYLTRDLANRSVLDATMSRLETTIASQLGRASGEKAKLQLAMLQSISNALTGDRTLLSLDVAGQGKAAIVIGNLKDADYVTYMVPGMFFTIEGQMVYWTDAAARLRDEQLGWLALYGDTTSTIATVAWIGYHTPNLTNIGSLENAEEARDSLASSIVALQTLRADDEPYVTVIGHSYGSTAALMALTEYDFDVDALALVGSAGSAAQS